MPHILIAEDNDLNRELFCELLSIGGYTAEAFSDGRELLKRLAVARADLLLVDIQMPNVDGYDVIKELKQDPALSSIPALALTALAMETDRERILTAGFDGYITKPVERVELFEEIERCLRSSS